MKIHLGKACTKSLENEDLLGKSVYLIVRKVKIHLGKVCTQWLESEDSHGKRRVLKR